MQQYRLCHTFKGEYSPFICAQSGRSLQWLVWHKHSILCVLLYRYGGGLMPDTNDDIEEALLVSGFGV